MKTTHTLMSLPRNGLVLVILALLVAGAAAIAYFPRPAEERSAASGWREAEPLTEPRAEFGAALQNGRIYVIGGYGAKGEPLASAEYRDGAQGRWRQAPPLPLALHHTAAAVLDGRLYVVGGMSSPLALPPQVSGAVFRLDEKRGRWEALPELSVPRAAHSVVALGRFLYAIGGHDSELRNIFVVERYDPESRRWDTMKELPEAGNHLVALTDGETVYAIGGRRYTSQDPRALSFENSPAVWRYDPEGDAWTRLLALPHGRSGLGAVAVGQGRLYVSGGEEDGKLIGQSLFIDVAGKSITAAASPRTVRHGYQLVNDGESVWALGGSIAPGFSVSSDAERIPLGLLHSLTHEEFRKLGTNEQLAHLQILENERGVEYAWRFVRQSYSTSNDAIVGNLPELLPLTHFIGTHIYKTKGLAGITLCGELPFSYGCFPGVFEEALKTATFMQARDACRGIEHRANKLLGCFQGIGQGLFQSGTAGFSLSGITKALGQCDAPGYLEAQFCWEGVFMGNLFSGTTLSGDSDNPWYPCYSVPEKYRPVCAHVQPLIMSSRFNMDFHQIAETCVRADNPKVAQHCLKALGEIVAQKSKGDLEFIKRECAFAQLPEANVQCISSAAKEVVFQRFPEGYISALELCGVLPAAYSNWCEERAVKNLLIFNAHSAH